jgi:fermentation-respiration switch protein FrsA (DUF1100 family)
MRALALVSGAVALAALVGLYLLAGALAAPRQGQVGAPPPDFPAQSVRIARDGGPPVAGWFAAGAQAYPGVLLLHSLRSDRRSMLGRAKFLLAAGYSVLLVDLQAHGETPGEHITFGVAEARDAHAALAYLRARVGGRAVGVIGVSLGGAAALLGGAPVTADAVVLESVYSSIVRAVENRLSMRLGPSGRFLAPLFTLQIEPRLGLPLTQLAPVSAIARLRAPVFIVTGSEDRRTRRADALALFARASEPKQLWLVEGAGHQDLHRFTPAAYERRVLGFLSRHLRVPPD